MELSIPARPASGCLHERQKMTRCRRERYEVQRDYVTQKKKAGESVQLLEIPHAGHLDLIDPASEALRRLGVRC